MKEPLGSKVWVNNPQYLATLKKQEKTGKCVFCSEGWRADPLVATPSLFVRPSEFPATDVDNEHPQHHLLVVSNEHEEGMDDEHFESMNTVLQKLKKQRISLDAFCKRFGEPCWSGKTMVHGHGHGFTVRRTGNYSLFTPDFPTRGEILRRWVQAQESSIHFSRWSTECYRWRIGLASLSALDRQGNEPLFHFCIASKEVPFIDQKTLTVRDWKSIGSLIRFTLIKFQIKGGGLGILFNEPTLPSVHLIVPRLGDHPDHEKRLKGERWAVPVDFPVYGPPAFGTVGMLNFPIG